MSWEVNTVNVNSVDAKLYNSPFSDYSAHQARNGSKIRMAHANQIYTPDRTAEELIPRSVPMPSKTETLRFQLDGNKMTNMIPGAQVDLPNKKTTKSLASEPIPAVPVAGTAVAESSSENYHTPKWQGARGRAGYERSRQSNRDGKHTELYHTPKWRGARARTGYMHDRKESFDGSGPKIAIIIIVVLAVLILAGFLIWKFIWTPRHKTFSSMGGYEDSAYEYDIDDYVDYGMEEDAMFGGKRKKSKKAGKKIKKVKKGKKAGRR